MENLVPIFLLIPLLGFLANGLVSKSDEQKLSQVTSAMLGVQFLAVLSFTVAWLISGHDNVYKQWFVMYESAGYHFYVDLYFDEVTAVFLAMGSILAFLITTYSRNYLLHELGYKRFFTTVLFFFLGYNIVVLSGNLTTVLVGWEFVGVSSFLLIAYYRNRFIPVKNAIKIFSLYRIGDIALLLSLWFLHQMVQDQHVTGFKDLYELVSLSMPHSPMAIGFGICILLAAAIKSAQFPFSAWLPRAMEGPTPSSAIFYTSLAVHLGVFLLLRTYDFWVHIAVIRNTIIAFGIISFLLSSFVAGSQHSIKGQIAYAVVAQVGLMFVEVALGYHWLALIHLFSHAMFRSYQMLISPSVVAFSIRRQLVAVTPRRLRSGKWSQWVYNSLYVLSLNE
ncbi:MAG: hypothetical protein KDC12_12025, partial [Flavobacteriales bacterium]|nr:hypothetical protein [Flavobacteriales bacterium]